MAFHDLFSNDNYLSRFCVLKVRYLENYELFLCFMINQCLYFVSVRLCSSSSTEISSLAKMSFLC